MIVLERIAARLAAEPRDRSVEFLAVDAVEVGACTAPTIPIGSS
jgi:hypothetical protein